jgi:hypothetical protein
MDIGTVLRKLRSTPRQYASPIDVAADMRLIWDNCLKCAAGARGCAVARVACVGRVGGPRHARAAAMMRALLR